MASLGKLVSSASLAPMMTQLVLSPGQLNYKIKGTEVPVEGNTET